RSHRRVSGQREAIDGFQHMVTLLSRIAVGLRQSQGSQRTDYLPLKLRSLQRDEKSRLDFVRLFAVDDFEHADTPGAGVFVGVGVKHGAVPPKFAAEVNASDCNPSTWHVYGPGDTGACNHRAMVFMLT